jgi:hypothetical protein
MHKKKDGVIPRIFVKESLNLQLWLKSYEGLMFQGLFCKFPEKNQKFGFSGIIFGRKNPWTWSTGCGPHRPSPPWTGGHCRVPELVGARKGEHEGGASAVKAAAGRALVRVTRGSEMGQGGAGEEGMLGHPFIGSEEDRGGWASEGNMRWRWCTIMLVEVVVSGGDRPGWRWGVMRGGGRPL